jgi:hypothetical protein
LGAVVAVVFDDDGMKHDEVSAHSEREAYDTVRDLYPQASWDGVDPTEEDE